MTAKQKQAKGANDRAGWREAALFPLLLILVVILGSAWFIHQEKDRCLLEGEILGVIRSCHESSYFDSCEKKYVKQSEGYCAGLEMEYARYIKSHGSCKSELE